MTPRTRRRRPALAMVRASLPILAVLFAGLAWTPPDVVSAASSSTFVAAGDGQVQNAYPTMNYGSLTSMRVRNNRSQIARSFVQFAVAGLSGSPTSVRLRLFAIDSSPVGGEIYAVASTWIESTLTWDASPALGASPLANVGPVVAGTWVELELGAGSVTTDGIYSFAIASGSPNSAYYSTREGSNAPELVIETDGPGPTPTPTPSATPDPTPTPTVSTSPAPPAPAPGATVIVFPVADAQVQDGFPTRNYGSLTTMRVRNSSGGIARSYLQFDVSGLSEVPSSVKLRLYSVDGGPNGGTAYKVANTWSESTLTWANAPTVGSSPLAAPGSVGTNAWVEFDLGPAAVTGNGIHSFVIAGGGGNSVYYATKESANSPELILEVGGPTPTPTPAPLLVVEPTADGQVQSAFPNSNYGSTASMRIRGGATPTRGYLQFVVAGLTLTPTAVSLRLYVDDAGPDGGSVYTVSNSWSEGSLTWNTAPAISGSPVGSAGSTTAGTWVQIALDPTSVTANGTVSFGIVGNDTNSVYYGTRESPNHPQLVITQGSGGPVPPTADFSAAPTSGFNPLFVQFTDLSTGGATSWSWDFQNDGIVDSTLRNPSFIYQSPGTYTVKLTATNSGGSSSKVVAGAVVVQQDPGPGGNALLVGAGDISDCGTAKDEETAVILDSLGGTVFTLGDNVYDNGTAQEFQQCYDPTWGRHKSRTRPASGNHEYGTSGASGYFGYFGAAAGDPTMGYYSYNAGAWHVVVLNSECAQVGGCNAGSPQETWLRADLAANPTTCTLAYWHRPRFSSGTSGSNTAVTPLWKALQDYGAELVLVGHDHIYERFAPQLSDGTRDDVNGIRQITVGTGGRALAGIGTIKANSQIRNNSTFGVLRLDLTPTDYTWQFLPIAGQTFTDSGTTACH